MAALTQPWAIGYWPLALFNTILLIFFWSSCIIFRIVFDFLWTIQIDKIYQPEYLEKPAYYGNNTEDDYNDSHIYLLFCL